MLRRVCVRTMGKTRKSFYAVRVGRNTGVFRTWEECEAQVKGYPGAVYKGFTASDEAEKFAASTSTGYSRGSRRTSGYQPYARPRPSRNYKARSSTCFSSSSSEGGSGGNRPVVYSDGCCFNNGRHNAKAGVGVYWGEGSCHNISERLEGHPTNQRAEIVSACRALESARDQGLREVELRTDSTYTLKAMTEWVGRWERTGWKTVGGENVKNKADLQRLRGLCQSIDVKWTHVRGHCGIIGNERADQLSKVGAMQDELSASTGKS